MTHTVYIIKIDDAVISFDDLDDAFKAYELVKKAFYVFSAIRVVTLEKFTATKRITIEKLEK